MLTTNPRSVLDNAAQESWKVMSTLRQRDLILMVYHDRYSSIVTVGGALVAE